MIHADYDDAYLAEMPSKIGGLSYTNDAEFFLNPPDFCEGCTWRTCVEGSCHLDDDEELCYSFTGYEDPDEFDLMVDRIEEELDEEEQAMQDLEDYVNEHGHVKF